MQNLNLFYRWTAVCVSVFDMVANKLHHKFETLCVEPKVIVSTDINPKFVGGELCLFSMLVSILV